MPFIQTRQVDPMVFRCWASVTDSSPILKLHWFNILCLLDSLQNIQSLTTYCLCSPTLKLHVAHI